MRPEPRTTKPVAIEASSGNVLDMDVQIRVRPRASGKKQADVTVAFVAV